MLPKKTYKTYKKIKIWDVNIDNIVSSIFIKTGTNSKYLIGQFDKAIKPLVFIMPKIC